MLANFHITLNCTKKNVLLKILQIVYTLAPS
jgi:hypothetical protein